MLLIFYTYMSKKGEISQIKYLNTLSEKIEAIKI